MSCLRQSEEMVVLVLQENKIFEEFIATSRYCRWLEKKGRRETWDECVTRFVDWITRRTGATDIELQETLYEAIYNKEVFPSMRALMTAGPAADVDEVCLYNCAYLPIDSFNSFSEVMYVLCCGTGVGFRWKKSR